MDGHTQRMAKGAKPDGDDSHESASRMTAEHQEKGGTKQGQRACRGVRIEKAANGGYTVQPDYEPEPPKKSHSGEQYPVPYMPEKPHVFADHKSMMAAVGKMLE